MEGLTLRIVHESRDRNESDSDRFNVGKLTILCPHDVDLFIWPDDSTTQLQTEVEGLHCSYGEQLRRCKVFEARTEYLQKSRNSCPSALFDVMWSSKDPMDLMNILGPAIRSFSLKPVRGPNLNMAALSAATSNCTNVESLVVSGRGLRRFADAYFRTPKPSLKKIVLVGWPSYPEFSHTLVGIAKHTGALREIIIRGHRVPVETLCIKYAEAERRSAPYIIDVISSFAGLKQLKSLTVVNPAIHFGPMPEVRDACLVMRYRNVSVRFNGIEYSLYK